MTATDRPLITYIRVSTSQQGRSGLGIEAQRQTLAYFAQAEGFTVAREFVEVETGKGSDALDRRPQLKAALFAALAEKERALISTRTRQALSAAKARGVTLGNPKLAVARKSAVEAVKVEADRYAANVLPIIREAQKAGASTLRQIADALIMSRLAPFDRTGQPTQAGVGRTLLLAAAGAIVGLATAGFGLFTAKGTSTLMVPAEDVALVNQQPISRVDYVALLQTLYSTDLAHATAAQKQRVLNDMIQEELEVQRGKELDVTAVDPQVRTAIVAAVEQQAAMPAFTDKSNEQKLRAFFEAHQGGKPQEDRRLCHGQVEMMRCKQVYSTRTHNAQTLSHQEAEWDKIQKYKKSCNDEIR